MSLLTLLCVLVAAGVIVWLVNRAPFLEPVFKTFITWAVIAVLALWFLQALLGNPLSGIRVGR